MKSWLNHLAAWLGLTNLWLLEGWDWLERGYATEIGYFRGESAAITPFLAIILLTTLSAFPLSVLSWALKGRWRAATYGLAVAASVWVQWLPFRSWSPILLWLSTIASFGLLWMLWHESTRERTETLLRNALLLAWIFAGSKIGSNVYLWSQLQSLEWKSWDNISGPVAERRLVWILFDELDARLAIEKRPPDLEMPQLDRLVTEGLYADRAVAPAKDTLEVVPSLLLGHPVEKSIPKHFGKLSLRLTGSLATHEFPGENTIFAKLAKEKVISSLIGWYHPYCELPLPGLAACESIPAIQVPSQAREAASAKHGVLWTMSRLLPYWMSWQGSRFVTAEADVHREIHLSSYQRIHAKALKHIANPSLGFVFAHYNIPHPYGIFDRRSKTLTTGEAATYIDNLALTDQVLADIEASMDPELRSKTAFLITADHGYRVRIWQPRLDWRSEAQEVKELPESEHSFFLFVHPKGRDGKPQRRLSTPFAAVKAHDLSVAYLKGEIDDLEDAERYLVASEANSSMRK